MNNGLVGGKTLFAYDTFFNDKNADFPTTVKAALVAASFKPKALYNKSELRFDVLSSDDVTTFVGNNGRTTEMGNTVATDGAKQTENYDRMIEFYISNKNGSKMFEYAVNRYDNPRAYNLGLRNCDHFAYDCLEAGGVYVSKIPVPNLTYQSARLYDYVYDKMNP